MTAKAAELNLGKSVVEQVKVPQALVITAKTSLSRVIGADNKPSEGLLLQKLDRFVKAFCTWPNLSTVQRQSLEDLILQPSASVLKPKVSVLMRYPIYRISSPLVK